MSLYDIGPLNELVKNFEDASVVWAGALQPIGMRLFSILAAIEMTWFCIAFMLSAEASLDKFLRVLLRKLFPLGMSLWIIALGPHYLPMVMYGFSSAGEQAVARSVLFGFQPSAFLNLGVQSLIAMSGGLYAGGYLNPFGGLILILALLCVGGLVFCFIAMTALMVATLAEAWFVIGTAPFLVAFGATRWTYGIAEAVLTHLLRVSIKLFVLYLYVALIASFATHGLSLLGAGTLDLRDAMLYTATCVVAAVMMFSVSRIAASLVPSHINWGLNPQTENL
ncbi:MAG: type IV secretion system protein [Acidobacteriota bacterium]